MKFYNEEDPKKFYTKEDMVNTVDKLLAEYKFKDVVSALQEKYGKVIVWYVNWGFDGCVEQLSIHKDCMFCCLAFVLGPSWMGSGAK